MKRMMLGVSSFVRRPGLVASALLALGLLSGSGAQAAPQKLTVSHPWIRFLTPNLPAAGYFTLYDGGTRPAVLVSADAPACGTMMLHESVIKNGIAHMKMVKKIVVPAHGSVTFHPGGYHLMCMQPASTMAPGQHVQVSLHFQDGSSLAATFPVYGAKGQ